MIGSELRWSDAPLGPPTKLSHALSFQPEKRILQGDLATIEPNGDQCLPSSQRRLPWPGPYFA